MRKVPSISGYVKPCLFCVCFLNYKVELVAWTPPLKKQSTKSHTQKSITTHKILLAQKIEQHTPSNELLSRKTTEFFDEGKQIPPYE